MAVVARKSDMEVGASIFALGVVLTIGSYIFADARGGGTYLVCYGPIFFGLIRMARGRGRSNPQSELPPAGDPRWGASRNDQVVGQTCAHCNRKIVVIAEGTRCKTCSRSLHLGDCQQKHVSVEHVATHAG